MMLDDKQLQDKIFKMCDQVETVLYFFKNANDCGQIILPNGVIKGLSEIMEKVVSGLCDLNEMGVSAKRELITSEESAAAHTMPEVTH